MLGIAGLYVYGMQAGRTSLFRHQAVTLAGDVAERIRANPTAGLDYAGAGANNNCVASGASCIPAEMAANDILLWKQQAADTLPNGDVTIVYNNGVPSIYTITVSWDEAGQAVAPTYVITIPVLEI
jgi:type IV pilus assembly protein PilV